MGDVSDKEKTRKWSDAPSRLLTIVIGAPTVFFIMYLGGLPYILLVSVVSMLCAVELQRMINRERLPIFPVTLHALAILVALSGWLSQFALLLGVVLLIMLFVGLSLRWMPTLRSRYFYGLSLVVGAIYIGLPLAVLLDIRDMPNGLAWTYLLFVNNWATDAFALIGGRIIGKTKLAPNISAGKTREGAVVGFVVGVLGGMIVAAVFGLPLLPSFVLNLMIASLTIVGDLIESIFKRYYQIKDTGNFLPGHGGFLDRVDGLVLATIPLYGFVLLLAS